MGNCNCVGQCGCSDNGDSQGTLSVTGDGSQGDPWVLTPVESQPWKRYAAVVTNSVAQSITNDTSTVVTISTVVKDDFGLRNPAFPNRLTANFRGLWMVVGDVEWAANAVGRRQVGFLLNGAATPTFNNDHQAFTALTQGQNTVGLYPLNAGDFVEMVVRQTSGGALNLNATSDFSAIFQMTFMGAFT